ncbi:MAG: hypothetical protein SOZ83_02315, partial [Sphaerochaetaceae bacterium]|nr:hypothetical protein [Sphaerochaetaceae bacterium]
IGKLLYDLEKKIYINNKINEELENLAKTLYEYWVVQFDFPDENNRPLISRIFAQISNLFRLAVQYA